MVSQLWKRYRRGLGKPCILHSQAVERDLLHVIQGQGEAPGFSQVAEDKSKEKVEARAFIGVPAGKASQGKQFRTVQFEYFWQALALGVVSSCLVTWP